MFHQRRKMHQQSVSAAISTLAVYLSSRIISTVLWSALVPQISVMEDTSKYII